MDNDNPAIFMGKYLNETLEGEPVHVALVLYRAYSSMSSPWGKPKQIAASFKRFCYHLDDSYAMSIFNQPEEELCRQLNCSKEQPTQTDYELLARLMDEHEVQLEENGRIHKLVEDAGGAMRVNKELARRRGHMRIE